MEHGVGCEPIDDSCYLLFHEIMSFALFVGTPEREQKLLGD